MKKLVFSALACVVLVGSSFASNLLEVQNANEDKPEQAVPCRWRTKYTHPDGTISYGPWTEGNCNKTIHEDGSTTLQPIGLSRN